MKRKGQGLGAQLLIIFIFVAFLALVISIFLYPQTTLQILDSIFETLWDLELTQLFIFVAIVVAILGLALLLVVFHFTAIFEEEEV